MKRIATEDFLISLHHNIRFPILNLLNREISSDRFCFRQGIGEICGVESCLARLICMFH